MNATRQISRRFGRSAGARTRSAADYSITATLSVVPDPLDTAAPVCRAGLRLKPGASLAVPPAPIVLHNSDHLISNLWGALGSVKRELKGIREAVLNEK